MNVDRPHRARLAAAGQEFLADYCETLEGRRRENLLRQLESIDLDFVTSLREGKGMASATRGKLEPLPFVPAIDRGPHTDSALLGAKALRGGKVAFALLAGGQGSRLRFDGPKGAYPIGPVSERSLFRILVEHVLRAGKDYGDIPRLAVTTSSTTDAATRHFFERKNCFGMERDRLDFVRQASLPVLDDEGRLILATQDKIFTSPDGHGGAVVALETEGILSAWEEAGVEVVCTFQVDNPLLKVVDADFVGRLLSGDVPVATKIVQKTDPAEKVGIIAKLDGRPSIVEYSEITTEEAQARDADGELAYRLGSIAVHAFRLEFLREVLARPLPLHPARKEIPGVDTEGKKVRRTGTKFERFLFDLLPMADDLRILEVEREREFAPVKNADGVDSPAKVRAALQNEYRLWYLEAGEDPPSDDALELSPLDVLGPDDLR